MSGTKSGGQAAAITNKTKYGPDFYKNIGYAGGKAGTGHKFGHGKVDPAVAGKKGGEISRRGKSTKPYTQQIEHTRRGLLKWLHL